MNIQEEIKKRRTFAIISHPDAGKTTITEQLLYCGGEIREAGTVKGKKTGTFAKSDWMDIEKQRGISVTSSVMQFDYDGKRVNILDTPGHEDFSEDTYRTLMAVDAAVMVEMCIRDRSNVEPVRTSRNFIRMIVFPLPGLWWLASKTRINFPSAVSNVIPAFRNWQARLVYGVFRPFCSSPWKESRRWHRGLCPKRHLKRLLMSFY